MLVCRPLRLLLAGCCLSAGLVPVAASVVEPEAPTPILEIPAGKRIYVALNGTSGAPGTEAQPLRTLVQAVSIVQPGDVIIMRGGVYTQTSTITIGTNRHGTAANPITLMAQPGETPIFDFTGQSNGNIGIRLNANHWRVIGLTIRHAGHNGIRMDGSNNRLERLVVHNSHDTGIHMAGTASHNLVFNCDSYHNFNTTGRVGNNADGFGVKFDDIGPGNRLYGCRSWENSDDGYDLWRVQQTVIIQNCWAFGNGNAAVFGNPANFEGGGNGFKLGGDHQPGDHVVIRSVAFDNFGSSNNAKGFDHNNNTGALTLIHNTAFNNGRNFTFPNNPQNGGQHVFQNNLSVIPGSVQLPSFALQEGNSWQVGTATASHLVSTLTELARSPRQADGSLPELDLLRPQAGTFIVDGGVDIGWAFNGVAPDMGAYEIAAPVGYEAWQLAQFTAAQRDDPAISGPAATPAQDGVANQLKYAFGLPALTPVTGALTPLRVEGDELILSYSQNLAATDIQIVVQVSGDMKVWTESAVVPVAVGDPVDGVQAWEVRFPLADVANRFVRLVVEPLTTGDGNG